MNVYCLHPALPENQKQLPNKEQKQASFQQFSMALSFQSVLYCYHSLPIYQVPRELYTWSMNKDKVYTHSLICTENVLIAGYCYTIAL
jgi:hypothetical protein